jgi:hypothetical protein
LSGDDSYIHARALSGMLSLSGPSPCAGRDGLPVRGDLAHIRLAGQCFVPHYAVPMTHRARSATMLLREPQDGAEIVAALAQGAMFEVLDISGNWAWGQLGEDGAVGYVALSALDLVTA